MSGRLVNRMLGKKAARRHKNLVREAVELKAKFAVLEDLEQEGEAEAAKGSNAAAAACCDGDDDDGDDDDCGEPAGAAAATAATTDEYGKGKGSKASVLSPCFDTSGRQIDLTPLANALQAMKQLIDATKIYEESNSQTRRSVAHKVMAESGEKIFKNLTEFINVFTKEKSQIAADFFTRLSMTSGISRTTQPSATALKLAKKLKQRKSDNRNGSESSEATTTTTTTESATQTDCPEAEPGKKASKRSSRNSSESLPPPPPKQQQQPLVSSSTFQTDQMISDLESENSVLKDKLFQAMNSSTAEMSELRAELERSKWSEGELEDQLRKSQVGKKEVQRLKSSLGEAENRSEQCEQAMAQMAEEMRVMKSRLDEEQQCSEGNMESERKKLLRVQMESLRSAVQLEIRTSEQYIRGLQHLLLLMRRGMPRTPAGTSLEQHVGLYLDFKAGLQDFLRRCEERGHDIHGESVGQLWSSFSTFLAKKRPQALASSTLEIIAPAIAAIVGDNEAAVAVPAAAPNRSSGYNTNAASAAVSAAAPKTATNGGFGYWSGSSVFTVPPIRRPPPPEPSVRPEVRHSTSSVARDSQQYQQLVSRIQRALPRLTTDECFRHLSVLKQNNNGKLSGLSVPHIIREIARQLPTTREADNEEEEGDVGGSYLKWVGVPNGGNNNGGWSNDHGGGRMGEDDSGSSSHNDDDGNGMMEECCICLSPLAEKEVTKLDQCNHVFHTECIRGWLKEKRDCPYCRCFSVMADEYPNLH